MTALASAILAAQPREKAGARTGARFAFQVHASLVQVLELHQEGADYRALFDHFDDLTILVASSELNGLRFYQIKGREPGPWKTTHFCNASGDAPRTTLCKMYHHTIQFSGQIEAAIFLTNAPFEFALATGGKSTPDHMVLAFPDLLPSVHAAFARALELDFPSPRMPHEGDIIRFERTRVPLVGYDTFVKGRLVEMLNDLPGSAITPLYRTLVNEITVKSNDTTICATIEDLYALKSLCRSDVEHVLSEAQAHRNILGHWESVDAEMKAVGRSLPARLKVGIAVTNYLRDRSKRMPETVALRNALKRAAASNITTVSVAATLCEAAVQLEGLVDPNLKAAYDAATWEAALLVEVFDAVNEQ